MDILLTTHDAGGLSARDVRLAKAIDGLLAGSQPPPRRSRPASVTSSARLVRGEVGQHRGLGGVEAAAQQAGMRRPVWHSWLVRPCTRIIRSRSGWMARQTSARLIAVGRAGQAGAAGAALHGDEPGPGQQPGDAPDHHGLVPMLAARRMLVAFAGRVAGDQDEDMEADGEARCNHDMECTLRDHRRSERC